VGRRPDGEPWEIYTVLADAEMPAGSAHGRPAEDAMLLCVGTGVRDALLLTWTRSRPAGSPRGLGTGVAGRGP
jgi:hypothetical protein